MKKSTALLFYVIGAMFIGAGIALVLTRYAGPAWVFCLLAGLAIKESIGSNNIRNLIQD